MTSIRFPLFALLITAVIGCGTHRLELPPSPPTPPKTCNAIWSKSDQVEHGDTVVIARCRGADEYAITSARKHWNHHWHLVPMDVLAIERGTWIEREVNFVYPDAWPTPESGIILDKGVFPFAKGYVFALTLNTSKTPATVVAFERRSYVVPYGPLKYIQLKPALESPYGRVIRAVTDFETAHKLPVLKAVADTPEDAGDAWIVHRRDGWGTNAGSWLYEVNKKTFTVKALP